MKYIDFINCIKCKNGNMKIITNKNLDKGIIKCTTCGFQSTINKGPWIINVTGEKFNYP